MRLSFAAMLGAGFIALSAVAAATGNFAVRLDQAAKIDGRNQPQAQVQVAAQNQDGIKIGILQITQGPATGFRQASVRRGAIDPNAGFNIYFEPQGLSTRFQNGQVQAAMTVDILIRDANKRRVAGQDGAWRLPVSHASATNVPLPSVYGDLSVNPLGLADGRYEILLRVHDDISGKFVDRALNVEVRGGANGAQRVSQAQPVRR